MSKSVCKGDSTNGIEMRLLGETTRHGMPILDELVVYVNGEVVLHIESMDDTYYWMHVGVGPHEVDAHFGSRGKAHCDLWTEDAK